MKKLAGFTFIFFVLQSSAIFANYVWEDITPSSAVLIRPNPDGFESSTQLYLCRIFTDGERWIPGKLYLANDMTRCIVSAYGQQLWSTEFQMLIAGLGTTSWVPSNGSVPSNAIVAGSHRDGAPGYACRALYEENLLLGDLAVGNGLCNMPYGTGEVTSRDGLELLVVNTYGLKFVKA